MKNQSGFNLVELMVVLTVAGIALAVGIPSFNSSVRNSRLTTGVNDFIATVHLARSEATKRGTPVTICRTNQTDQAEPACGTGDSWLDGWVVFADADNDAILDTGEIVIQVHGAQHEKLTVISDVEVQDSLTFLANGFASLDLTNSGPRFIVYCDDSNSDDFARVLSIGNTGRPRIVDIDSQFHAPPSCEST